MVTPAKKYYVVRMSTGRFDLPERSGIVETTSWGGAGTGQQLTRLSEVGQWRAGSLLTVGSLRQKGPVQALSKRTRKVLRALAMTTAVVSAIRHRKAAQ